MTDITTYPAHTEECVNRSKAQKALYAMYLFKWSRYCRECGGTGWLEYQEYHDSYSSETVQEPCICVETHCPRCGSEELFVVENSDDYYECVDCGWNDAESTGFEYMVPELLTDEFGCCDLNTQETLSMNVSDTIKQKIKDLTKQLEDVTTNIGYAEYLKDYYSKVDEDTGHRFYDGKSVGYYGRAMTFLEWQKLTQDYENRLNPILTYLFEKDQEFPLWLEEAIIEYEWKILA